MKVTIHQPEHMPWLGFFHKIAQADYFVVLDNVQFRKNYFQNRNRVRTTRSWSWITVPVHQQSSTLIKDVTIVEDPKWRKKWWSNIYFSYKKAEFFNRYSEQLSEIINNDWEYLADLNLCLINFLREQLGIKIKLIRASELNVQGSGSDLILNICKSVNAELYCSGISGRDYLKEEDFIKEGIKITYQEFHHPIYKQLYEPFIPCMSVIDLLFNHGPRSLEIINGVDVPVMEEVFT